MKLIPFALATTAGILLFACALAGTQVKPTRSPTTKPAVDLSPRNAKAVFAKYCAMCHGPKGAMKGKFSTDWATMVRVQKAVVPGKPARSEAFTHLTSPSKPMPPKGIQPRPAAVDIAAIKLWISRGAKKWD